MNQSAVEYLIARILSNPSMTQEQRVLFFKTARAMFHDQIENAWYCGKEKMYVNAKGDEIPCYHEMDYYHETYSK
jgi:hypothetical protein